MWVKKLIDNFNKKWLEHLPTEVIQNIQGNYLDAYVVALEGWRRGLTLKWHTKDSEAFKHIKKWYVDQPGQLFSLHSDKRSHYFFRTRGDLISKEAVEIGMNKETTKLMLSNAKVPVPEGRQFTKIHSRNEIIQFIDQLGYPVVIKPTDGSFGRGVFSDIKTKSEVHLALEYLYNDMKETDIIVEKYIPGKDYRIYVVNDKVVGAILREPPNIKGDGINNIEALIKEKNELRRPNPRLSGCPIILNDEIVDYIKRYNYTINSVPKPNEIVYLSDKGNVSIGGDPIDVLDELSEDIKKIAVQALRAIPDLYHGAVDIISADNKTGYVLELNPTAQIGGLLFPLCGKPRDIPKMIIDFYFPETSNHPICYNMYFDYSKVLKPLERNMAHESTVKTISPENIVIKEILLTGHVNELNLHQYFRKECVARGIDGKLKETKTNHISLVIAADAKEIDQFINKVIKQISDIKIVEISNYNKPIKAGFEIENVHDNLIRTLNEKQQKVTDLQLKQKRLSNQYSKMLQSTSWKITKPLRLITGLVRRQSR